MYIVTELYEKNLSEKIKYEKSGLNIDEIKEIFFQINEAFKYLRKNNYRHCNLKLENIVMKKIKIFINTN